MGARRLNPRRLTLAPLPPLSEEQLAAQTRARRRFRLRALPFFLLFAVGTLCAHAQRFATEQLGIPDRWVGLCIVTRPWLHLGLLLSLLALWRGTMPRWLSAQLSLTETERQKKLREINHDPLA